MQLICGVKVITLAVYLILYQLDCDYRRNSRLYSLVAKHGSSDVLRYQPFPLIKYNGVLNNGAFE